jgi:hypothetical protein
MYGGCRIDYLPVAWETLRVENIVLERERHGMGFTVSPIFISTMHTAPANSGLHRALCNRLGMCRRRASMISS